MNDSNPDPDSASHRLRGISGSSILGSGEVALIFDTPSLGLLAAPVVGWGGASCCGPAFAERRAK